MKLLAGERLINQYRQTKLVLAAYFLFCAALIYFPIAFLSKYGFSDSLGTIFKIWEILVILYFINHLILWGLNYTLLTSSRMLIIRYHSLLHKHVTDLPKDRIVNISYEKKGLFAALFDFGNVVVQQQSLAEPVILKHLPNPSNIKDEFVANMK